MDILDAIRSAIGRHDLILRGETVVVGVSGGPDSLCLLHALIALRDEFGYRLHVAHLNHQLRGADADADARFVAGIAKQWGTPYTLGRRDVNALAHESKLSIEEAARHARYAFLAQVAQVNGSHTVAVAHNADDQTESVLMHFLRGSGSAGLRGMLPTSEISDLRFRISDPQFAVRNPELKLVRPLLAVPRADIEAYCREHDLRPRFDESNLDTTYFRNRLRHELLPALETYNPNIREVLRRTADVVAADVEVLREATERAWREAVASETHDAVHFKLGEWRGLSLALRRATLREAIRRLCPSLRNINFVHVENAVRQLDKAQTGARVTLPQGLMVSVGYHAFTIAHPAHELDLSDWPLLPVPRSAKPITLRVRAVTPLPDSDWSLETTYLKTWGDEILTNPDPWTAYLDASAIGSGLSIRARQTGDVFHPQGMPSPVRLSDWMTNVKIPRYARDRLPLIVAGDRIAWISGFRVGQPFIVTSDTRRVIKLSFSRLVDSPMR